MIHKSYLSYILLISLFFNSVFLYAQDLSSHLSRGHSLYFQGFPEEALEEYQKALAIAPRSFQAHVNMGIIYRDLNLYNKAIDSYNTALRISEHAFLSLLLGWAYYNINDFDKSEETFKSVLSLTTVKKNPSLIAETHYGLGNVYFKKKLYKKAKNSLEKAISIKPAYAAAYFRLGMIYEEEGNIRQALENYEKVLKYDYNFSEVRFYLARLYLQEKSYEKAFKQYNKLSNLDPKNIEAEKKKEEILTLLAKKHEDIIPPRRIEKHSSIAPASERDKITLLRIGIGVDSAGKPLRKDIVRFRCSGAFTITKESDNSTIAGGDIEQTWRIELKEGKFSIFDEEDNVVGPFSDTILIKLLEPEVNTIIIQNIGYGKGFPWGGEEDREYRGEIEISLSEEYGLKVVNIINVEEYLYSVLPSEMMIAWPLEALKAQAVIARSEALYKKRYVKPHTQQGYDLCDDQNCQVYKGVKNEYKKSTQAVNATRGEILLYKDKIAHTLYSSNAGGHTQSSRELDGWGDVHYLEGVLDAPDTTKAPYSPYTVEKWIKIKPDVYSNLPEFSYPAEFRWVNIIKREDLEERINRTYQVGTITAITPLKRSKSGHVNAIRIKGTEGEITITREHKIRRQLSAGFLRSNLFLIETSFNEDNLPDEFTIYGGGWGHGVGMCQTGAAGMAYKESASYKDILYHYYKDTRLEKVTY